MSRQSLKWAAAAVAAQVAVVVLSPIAAVLQAHLVHSPSTAVLQAHLARTALTEAPWATLAVFLCCLYRERFLTGSAGARRVAACAALVFWLLQGLAVVFGLLALVFDHVIKVGTTGPPALILLQCFAWVAFLAVFVKGRAETGSPFVRWLAAVLGAVTVVRGFLLIYGEAAKEIRDWPIAGWGHPTFGAFWYYALFPVVFALGWIPLAAFLFACWRPTAQPRAAAD